MSRKPTRAKYRDRLYNIALRVKGSQKNEIMQAAKRNKMQLSQYILYCVWEHMRSERGIAPPGPSQFKIAEPMDHLRAYLSGETLLMPCGQQKCEMKIVQFDTAKFCETCNVRVE
jgi:hypothetical protein